MKYFLLFISIVLFYRIFQRLNIIEKTLEKINFLYYGNKTPLENNIIEKNSVETSKEKPSIQVTSKEINVTFQLYIWNILLFFFPNSFSNEEEAYNYYKTFLEKAKRLGEDEAIWRDYSKEITFTVNIDLLSGNKTYWNWFYKIPNEKVCFPFFSSMEIKDKELKEEVKKLYYDNYEHLNKDLHGYARKYEERDELLSDGVGLCITYLGFDFWRPFYSEFESWAERENLFALPIESIIYYLHDIANGKATEEGLLKEFEEYKNSYKLTKIEKPEYEEKALAEGGNIIVENKYIRAYISVKHNFPIFTY